MYKYKCKGRFSRDITKIRFIECAPKTLLTISTYLKVVCVSGGSFFKLW